MIYINDRLDELDLAAVLPLLSEQRREQVLRFKHEAGQRQCAAAYLLLMQGLREEYAITDKPVFEYGEHGKPVMVGLPHIHFNLSHCREAAVCMLADRPVGVDIETIRDYKESLVRYTMSDAELQQIQAADRPDVEFTRLWTQKEAVLKQAGTGIRTDMKTVLTGVEHVQTVVCEEKGYVYSVVY
ncbi:MAG: 4'-phosphopantetheinyl transferase superfamily protein [Prevotella sp.]|nr:4'-phosphopantetheinyl transferase superfamily protein [Prevotella sp.]